MSGKPPRKNRPFEPIETLPQYDNIYDSVEFQLATGQTDYNVRTVQTSSFINAPRAHSLIIKTDQTITVKFNDNTNSSHTISRGEGSLTITRNMGFEITNIFITNASGNTANIKIFLIP
jgi:hypothetical protein